MTQNQQHTAEENDLGFLISLGKLTNTKRIISVSRRGTLPPLGQVYIEFQTSTQIVSPRSDDTVAVDMIHDSTDDEKLTVCHQNQGNQDPTEIDISLDAWPAHKAHGDHCGNCDKARNQPNYRISTLQFSLRNPYPAEVPVYASAVTVAWDSLPPHLRTDECPDTDGDGKITICHHPPGTPENTQSITIDTSGWQAHQRHGDTCGPCTEGDSTKVASEAFLTRFVINSRTLWNDQKDRLVSGQTIALPRDSLLVFPPRTISTQNYLSGFYTNQTGGCPTNVCGGKITITFAGPDGDCP